MKWQFDETNQGWLIPIRAVPGAKSNRIHSVSDGVVKVMVTQIAEKGKANKALIQVFCKSLKLKRSQVTLAQGETSRDKVFLVCGIDETELKQRLSDC